MFYFAESVQWASVLHLLMRSRIQSFGRHLIKLIDWNWNRDAGSGCITGLLPPWPLKGGGQREHRFP